jgi:hypothetical protein
MDQNEPELHGSEKWSSRQQSDIEGRLKEARWLLSLACRTQRNTGLADGKNKKDVAVTPERGALLSGGWALIP